MSRLVVILVIVLLAGGLTACGKKGPLEAPSDSAGVVTHQARPA